MLDKYFDICDNLISPQKYSLIDIKNIHNNSNYKEINSANLNFDSKNASLSTGNFSKQKINLNSTLR